ncbi:MAG: STAS domain-containing protein [Acidobacteria bacterium]|nr:STAS domain-containing protein [Acidobacteriota bacterium]MCW5948282.1 STAS domain-containing protein [Pyrinomonadaceae bacterium]
MIRETSPETNDDATATAVITAGDYLNKLAGESIERLCREKLDSGVKRLVVDFSETEIINSIGVSILLDVIDSAKKHDAKVVFAELREDSRELFDMLGLTKHVTIV